MKNHEIISMHDLQVFAEGGPAVGTAPGISAGGAGVNAPAAGVQPGVKGNRLAGNMASVSVPAAEVQNKTEQSTTADLAAEFDALIKGKFKDQYNARVQDTIQKRLKGPSEAAEKYRALTPTIELLSKKYGLEAHDIEGLNKAIEEDNSFYEDEALARGLTIQQLKEVKKMERENAALRRQQEEVRRQQESQRQYETWFKQAENAKLKYPNLDLAVEIQNPQFMDLLRANIDVEAAYKVIHQDDIISGAMEAAVRNATQKVANSISANGARPSENGSGQGAATVKVDVSKMTKKQRQDYIRRSMMGEKISF
jgi:hypothetical protein